MPLESQRQRDLGDQYERAEWWRSRALGLGNHVGRLQAENERLRAVANEALRCVLKMGHGDTALWDALHEVFPEEVPAGD